MPGQHEMALQGRQSSHAEVLRMIPAAISGPEVTSFLLRGSTFTFSHLIRRVASKAPTARGLAAVDGDDDPLR